MVYDETIIIKDFLKNDIEIIKGYMSNNFYKEIVSKDNGFPLGMLVVKSGQLTNLFCKTFLALLCVLTVFVSASSAQSDANQNVDKQDSQITLSLKDVDIRVLIDTVAEVSGKNFIVDPRVKGKVSVISGSPMQPDQLYDMFLSILEVHNFATVDSGYITKILPSNVIKQRPTPTLFGRTTDNSDAQITQIIQLEHASVQDLVPIVRPLIPPTSHFAPHIPSNSVVITDTTANIQRVLQIINRIDVPDKRANVRVVYLDNATASDLANTLSQLVASTADPAQAGGAPAVSIQALDSINALVISAPDDAYTKIRALINELDIQREIKSNVNVVYLKHANAVDLVGVLTDVAANTGNDGAAGQNDFVVQADEATNSLIVRAPPAEFVSIQSIIDKLDIRRAQVYIEAVIANVSSGQVENFGINWDGGDPLVGTSRSLANNVAGDLSNLDLTNGGGLTFSLFNAGSDQLNLIVDAIRTDSNSNILSTPTILTLDNEEAEIVVGQEVPFITGSFSSTDGDGNAFQTIERQDVGILLRVRPQINDGDTIQLEVEQEISSVSEVVLANESSDLITDTSSINAIIQADHGQVVVLGGLMSDQVDDTVSGVPVLSRIPLLGALFRSKGKTVTRQNLMVFLKPYIIRSPDQLVQYSKLRYNQTRQAEIRSLKGSSKYLVPGAKPAVLDEYDNVTGDQTFGTVRTRKLDEKYEKKQRKRAEKEGRKVIEDSDASSNVVPQEAPQTTGSTTGDNIESGTYVPTRSGSLKQ